MKNQCVVSTFDTLEDAKLAIHTLDRSGLVPDRVSLVTQHIDPDSELAAELSIENDSLRDAAIGSALGGAMGVLGDAALFMATGIGTVLVAGPLVAATGVVVGGLIGAMEGWGIHKSKLRKYEELLRDGKILVVVEGAPSQVAEADRMLRQTVATEVHLIATSDDEAAEIEDRS